MLDSSKDHTARTRVGQQNKWHPVCGLSPMMVLVISFANRYWMPNPPRPREFPPSVTVYAVHDSVDNTQLGTQYLVLRFD